MTLYYVLSETIPDKKRWADHLDHALSKVLRRPRTRTGGTLDDLVLEMTATNPYEKIILSCEWFVFYDVLEELFSVISKGEPRNITNHFESLLNEQLEEEGIGWRMRQGLLERIGTEYTDQTVERARILLRDDLFVGPDEQFEKAIRFFNMRPEPDEENCVKEAVGALEGTARILAKDKTAKLSDILKREAFRSRIHGDLRELMQRVYSYRGSVGGVAHGQVGTSKVASEEAQFVLAVCAAAIVHLANKFEVTNP